LPAGGDAETLVRHGAGTTSYARETHGLDAELGDQLRTDFADDLATNVTVVIPDAGESRQRTGVVTQPSSPR
jgi:hypothetical protein